MHQDNWSLKAKKMGYRSRAVFKLEEILLKLHKNQINKVLDLGSAPGGWSQFIINTTEGSQSIRDSASIRQSALRNKIFCTTTMFGAFAIIDALQGSENDWTYTTLQELNK